MWSRQCGRGTRIAIVALLFALVHTVSSLPIARPVGNRNPAKLNTIIRMVNEFMGHGRLQEALSMVERNLKCCFPDNFSLLEQHGLILNHLGHQQEAIKKYEQALAAHPSHEGTPGLLSNLALSQEQSGDDEGALKNYETALKLQPNLKGARVNIANYYRIHSMWDKAAENLEKAIKIDPNDDIAVGGLGAVYMDQHKWAAAEKMFRRSIELNPKSWAARTELGNVLLRMDRDEAARKSFESVTSKNAAWYRAHDGLAAYYIKHNKKDLAKREAKKALKLRTGDQYSLDLLSQARHSSREAEKHFNAIVTYSDQYDHIVKHKPHPEYATAQPASFSMTSVLLLLLFVAGLGCVIWFLYTNKSNVDASGYASVRLHAQAGDDYDTGFESTTLMDDDLTENDDSWTK